MISGGIEYMPDHKNSNSCMFEKEELDYIRDEVG